ncbi:MAG: PP2C family protein-serine/threonine phosphatase [archaeon]
MVPGNWGDINIVDEIRLQGKDYLVILNADAMGKSIQEAGGAIVMGALFRSIIERTKMASHVSLNSPERWLKNTWSEIQKVFESFDGSMLVSAVIALLDLEKGILYSLNAEYPPIVLLRDGVASYLHNNFTSRKFGTLGIFPKIEIKVDCLQVEDILIFGSDGRDDLLVTTPTGEKRINEDENLFLRIVEEADGSLDRIVLGLSEKGEITDDLSLILIEYLGSEEKNLKKEIPIELTRKDGDYLEISKQMIYSHIKNKNKMDTKFVIVSNMNDKDYEQLSYMLEYLPYSDFVRQNVYIVNEDPLLHHLYEKISQVRDKIKRIFIIPDERIEDDYHKDTIVAFIAMNIINYIGRDFCSRRVFALTNTDIVNIPNIHIVRSYEIISKLMNIEIEIPYIGLVEKFLVSFSNRLIEVPISEVWDVLQNIDLLEFIKFLSEKYRATFIGYINSSDEFINFIPLYSKLFNSDLNLQGIIEIDKVKSFLLMK